MAELVAPLQGEQASAAGRAAGRAASQCRLLPAVDDLLRFDVLHFVCFQPLHGAGCAAPAAPRQLRPQGLGAPVQQTQRGDIAAGGADGSGGAAEWDHRPPANPVWDGDPKAVLSCCAQPRAWEERGVAGLALGMGSEPEMSLEPRVRLAPGMWHHQQKDQEQRRVVQGDSSGLCLQWRCPANQGRNNHRQEERSSRHPPASSRSQEQLQTGNLPEPLLYLYEPRDSRTKTVQGNQCASPALPPVCQQRGPFGCRGFRAVWGIVAPHGAGLGRAPSPVSLSGKENKGAPGRFILSGGCLVGTATLLRAEGSSCPVPSLCSKGSLSQALG